MRIQIAVAMAGGGGAATRVSVRFSVIHDVRRRVTLRRCQKFSDGRRRSTPDRPTDFNINGIVAVIRACRLFARRLTFVYGVIWGEKCPFWKLSNGTLRRVKISLSWTG